MLTVQKHGPTTKVTAVAFASGSLQDLTCNEPDLNDKRNFFLSQPGKAFSTTAMIHHASPHPFFSIFLFAIYCNSPSLHYRLLLQPTLTLKSCALVKLYSVSNYFKHLQSVDFGITKYRSQHYGGHICAGSRLTAFELVHEELPSTLLADSGAAALMALGKVDAVVVGADRIAANGDTANKIGTYSLAVNAAHHR